MRELLVACVPETTRNLDERLYFAEGSASDGHVIRVFATMCPTVTLGDVRRNRHGRSTKLTLEPVRFVAWETAHTVRFEGEDDTLLPDDEMAMMRDRHGSGGLAWDGATRSGVLCVAFPCNPAPVDCE